MWSSSLNPPRIYNLFCVVRIRIISCNFLWRNTRFRTNITIVENHIVILLFLLLLKGNINTLVLTQFRSIAFVPHVSKSLRGCLIELIFSTRTIEKTLTCSHVWRSIVFKNNTVVIIMGLGTSSRSTFDLRVVCHEILKLLVVLILGFIGNVNRL